MNAPAKARVGAVSAAALKLLGTLGPAVAAALLPSFPAAACADEPVRVACPAVADTSLLGGSPQGTIANLGGAEQLGAQGNSQFLLLRFDLSGAEGLAVTQATLRFRRVQTLLVRVGVSTVAAEWDEGTSTTPEPQEGGACYHVAAYSTEPARKRWWAQPGSDFSDVVFGRGGSRWVPRVPRYDKASRWYEIDVPPEFLQAMLQGLQPGGLCVSDDFGRQETNPLVWSRESRDPPELIVEGLRTAPTESRSPSDLRASRAAIGQEWLTFVAPHALGFEIYLSAHPINSASDSARARKLPTWALPTPGADTLRALLSLHRAAGDRFVAVRVVESARDWSPLVAAELPAPIAENPSFTVPTLPRYDLPTTFDAPFALDDGPGLSLEGRWMRSAAKTWWHPQRGPVALQAGRNEFVAFQVILAGGPGTYAVTMTDWQAPGSAEPAPRVQFFRQHYAKGRLGQEKYAPDGAVPIEPGQALQLELLSPTAATQPTTQPVRRDVVQGVWVDIYVPHKAARGVWRSRLIALHDGVATLDIPVELEVVGATLPDTLNFRVSLGTRRLPAEAFDVDESSAEAWPLLESYQRLAHQHRTTLTVVPYTADGQIHAGFAPACEQRGAAVPFDWDDWDRRFGRYFDGSAFRDLPRAGAPLDHFILPFHENWPLPLTFQRAAPDAPLAGKYHYVSTPTERTRATRPGPPRDTYMVWPFDDAFTPEFKAATAAAVQAFARHLKERGWDRTELHIALRNNFGRTAHSSWWFLGDPQVYDDFLALRFWLGLYRRALDECGDTPIRLRMDLTTPEFERGTLAGLVDVAVQNATLVERDRLGFAAPQRPATIWDNAWEMLPEYGWAQVYKSIWAARLAGARGFATSQAVALDEDWNTAADRALLYPGLRFGYDGPYPSLRLKALRRAQQDVEWLERWLETAVRARDIPEGYGLAVVALKFIERAGARTPNWTTVLPLLRFPGRVDTVVFEEVRRGLRQVALD